MYTIEDIEKHFVEANDLGHRNNYHQKQIYPSFVLFLVSYVEDSLP